MAISDIKCNGARCHNAHTDVFFRQPPRTFAPIATSASALIAPPTASVAAFRLPPPWGATRSSLLRFPPFSPYAAFCQNDVNNNNNNHHATHVTSSCFIPAPPIGVGAFPLPAVYPYALPPPPPPPPPPVPPAQHFSFYRPRSFSLPFSNPRWQPFAHHPRLIIGTDAQQSVMPSHNLEIFHVSYCRCLTNRRLVELTRFSSY